MAAKFHRGDEVILVNPHGQKFNYGWVDGMAYLCGDPIILGEPIGDPDNPGGFRVRSNSGQRMYSWDINFIEPYPHDTDGICPEDFDSILNQEV